MCVRLLQLLFTHVTLILTSQQQVLFTPFANNCGIKIILNGLLIITFLAYFDFELIHISDELRRLLFFGNRSHINYPSKCRLPLDLLLFYLTLIVHSRQTECSARLDFLWKVQATGENNRCRFLTRLPQIKKSHCCFSMYKVLFQNDGELSSLQTRYVPTPLQIFFFSFCVRAWKNIYFICSVWGPF